MNKILRGLLVAMLAVSSQAQAATTAPANTNNNYVGQTFMSPRSHGVNLAIENVGFAELVNRKAEEKFGGNFQIAGYWQQSKDTTNATATTANATTSLNNTASYFLTDPNSNAVVIKAGVLTAPLANPDSNTLLQANYLIKAGFAADQTISMNPLQKSWGVTFGYNQDLGKVFEGLYMYATLPVAGVENNLNLNAGTAGANATTITNYFAGKLGNTTTPAGTGALSGGEQAELKYAQINGSQKQTGVADLNLGLGYKFFDRENYYAKLALAITAPTGNKATGQYLFEPIVGNGGHVGLGFDFDGQAKVWGEEDHNLKVSLIGQYRYLFDANDVRTLTLNGYPMGQYYLTVAAPATALTAIPLNASGAGAALASVGDLVLTPLANLTTLPVNVKAGSQFEGLLGLAYNNGGFSLDLGYNLYYRDAETVSLKNTFVDNQAAIADPTLNTSGFANNNNNANAVTLARLAIPAAPFPAAGLPGVADASVSATAGLVNQANMNFIAAGTQSQLTHKIYAGLSYSFKEWDNPMFVGVFGGYEFVSRNSALEQWNVGAKAGLGF